MAYALLMKNVPLNNSYSDVIHFRNVLNVPTSTRQISKINKIQFFNYYSNNKYGDEEQYYRCNFSVGDILTTSIILPYTADNVSANYVHIMVDSADELFSGLYEAYYFITDIKQLNKQSYVFNLELDVWTTFNERLSFSTDIYTERKHAYRWSKKIDNKRYLDCIDASLPDVIDDNFNASILTEINQLNYTKSDELNRNNFLKDVIWCYVYTTSNLQIGTPVGDTRLIVGDNEINLNYHIFIFPINKVLYAYKQGATEEYQLFHNISEYIETTNIIGIKISTISHFSNDKINEIFRTDDNKISIKKNLYDVNDEYRIYTNTTGENFLSIEKVYNNNDVVDFSNYIKNGVSSSLVDNFNTFENKIYYYEPKMYTTPYMLQGLQLPYSELLNNSIYIYNTHYLPFEVDYTINRSGLCLLNENYEMLSYNGNNVSFNKNMEIGLGLNNPCDLPYDVDAYKQALATSRNSMVMGMLTSTTESAVKGYIKGGTTGAITSGLTSGVTNLLNFGAKMQDLRNTPSTMASNGSSITCIVAKYGNLNPYYVSYELNEKEKEIAFDYFYNNGYQVNRMCQFNNDCIFPEGANFDNTLINRKLFNYIKTDDESLVAKMNFDCPIMIKQQIANIFQNGFKLWMLTRMSGKSVSEVIETFLSEKYENWEFVRSDN